MVSVDEIYGHRIFECVTMILAGLSGANAVSAAKGGICLIETCTSIKIARIAHFINSSPPSPAYMRQRIESALAPNKRQAII